MDDGETVRVLTEACLDVAEEEEGVSWVEHDGGV